MRLGLGHSMVILYATLTRSGAKTPCPDPVICSTHAVLVALRICVVKIRRLGASANTEVQVAGEQACPFHKETRLTAHSSWTSAITGAAMPGYAETDTLVKRWLKTQQAHPVAAG
jgi:hypothetical protein